MQVQMQMQTPMQNIKRRSAIALALAALAPLAPLARAQPDWPNRPITLMLGFAPGGPNDIVHVRCRCACRTSSSSRSS